MTQFDDLIRKLDSVSKKEVPRAVSSTLNKVTAKVRTRIVKAVAKTTGVPQKLIRQRVYQRKSSVRTQRARITAYRAGISYSLLRARQTRAGVRAGRHSLPGAFIAPVQNPKGGYKRLVVRRFGAKRRMTKGHYVGQIRQPIKAQFLVIKDRVDEITPKVAARVVKSDLAIILARDLKYRLSKYH